jgi:hypothetical protein
LLNATGHFGRGTYLAPIRAYRFGLNARMLAAALGGLDTLVFTAG